jgi:hypothetical protein
MLKIENPTKNPIKVIIKIPSSPIKTQHKLRSYSTHFNTPKKIKNQKNVKCNFYVWGHDYRDAF